MKEILSKYIFFYFAFQEKLDNISEQLEPDEVEEAYFRYGLWFAPNGTA